MKKPISIPRVRLFVILFAAIVIAHIIILRVVIRGERGSTPPPEPEKAQTTTSGGLRDLFDWQKNAPSADDSGLFGMGKKTYRYRKPNDNPNFGKPLEFNGADTSDMQKRFVPKMEKWEGTGIIVDMDTHRVLWEKEARKPVPIASMTKMMTVLLVAEELERNPKLSPDTEITVTQSAMNAMPEKERSSASRIGLDVGSKITVRDLLLCVLLPSANDAADMLAEVVGGDVDKFIARMNDRAKELGFTSMKFYTSNGLNNWRGKERLTSVASAADMVRLGERLLEYPILAEMMSKKSAQVTVNGKQRTIYSSNILINTNDKHKLLRGKKAVPGVDGMKTGSIRVSGACLTFSVLRDGRRMIGCVTRFPNHQDRYDFCSKLIDWAYDPGSVNKPKRSAGTGKRTPRKPQKKK